MRIVTSLFMIAIFLTGCATVGSVSESCEASTKTFAAMVDCIDRDLATRSANPRLRLFTDEYLKTARSLNDQVVSNKISETEARTKLSRRYRDLKEQYESGAPIPVRRHAKRPSRPAGGPTEAETSENRARPYLEGRSALERFRKRRKCTGKDAKTVQARIKELEEMVSAFHTVRIRGYERQSRDRHTELAFAFAKAALDFGCLEQADAVYRRLLSFYTGMAYAGIRDLAKIGIQDVRDARNTARR